MSAEAAKEACGRAAAALVAPGTRVGLGTGSTAAAFVRALGARRGELPGLRCAATSEATAELARSVGLTVEDVDVLSPLDLVVDGADEVDPELRLIKGGGAALLREKLVWEAAARRLVIADAGKLVPRLGAFPLPVEIIPFAWRGTRERVRAVLDAAGLGAVPTNLRGGEAAPMRTDQGNLILDLACGSLPDPEGLAARLKAVTGVVEHGLFIGYADELLVADAEGAVTRRSASAARSTGARAAPAPIGGGS